jgi:hypothetical protein
LIITPGQKNPLVIKSKAVMSTIHDKTQPPRSPPDRKTSNPNQYRHQHETIIYHHHPPATNPTEAPIDP